MKKNILFHGDNLDILRKHGLDESIDLIYLDPPFNTGRIRKGRNKAFSDAWRWDQTAILTYQETVKQDSKIARALFAFQALLGNGDMLAYLTMMAPRLLELQRVLKPTGSIYLHCDPMAGHYLKILMDVTFGMENFRNEIAWCYASGGASKRHFARKHDTIFRYTKTRDFVFNVMREPYATLNVSGRKGFHPDGRMLTDVWPIAFLSTTSRERVGYPTQKPEALLERIIKASSNEDDLVLDPFCGSGTTAVAAEKLGRRWIICDNSSVAISVAQERLLKIFNMRLFVTLSWGESND